MTRSLLPAALIPAMLSITALGACSSQKPAPAGNDARAEWPVPAATDNAGGNALENGADNASAAGADDGSAAANAAEPAAPPAPRPVALPRPGAFYHARGTEPFWAVTLYGGTLMLERPDKPTQHFAVRRDGDRYTGDGIQMALSQGPCSDGMSERYYPETIQIALSGAVLKGCGGEPLPERDHDADQ
jgi:uncharacterized membrane protein